MRKQSSKSDNGSAEDTAVVELEMHSRPLSAQKQARSIKTETA